MKFSDILDELCLQTARIFTFEHFRAMLAKSPKEAKAEIEKTYGMIESLYFCSVLGCNDFVKYGKSSSLRTEYLIRLFQVITMRSQKKATEEVLGLCSHKDRVKLLEEKCQEARVLAKEVFDRIPDSLKVYEKRIMDDVRYMRPRMFDHTNFGKRYPKPVFDVETFNFSGDTSLCEAKLDDLIPHTFYYGDNIKRCGTLIALFTNSQNLNQNIDEIEF